MFDDLLVDDETEQTERTALRLMNITYTGESNERPLIHIIGRESTGDRVHIEVQGFEPYFYTPKEQIGNAQSNSSVTGTLHSAAHTLDGKPVSQVWLKHPDHRNTVCGRFRETYEADVRFTDRFLIDKEIYTTFECPLDNTITTEGGNVIQPHFGDYRVHHTDVIGVDEDFSVDPRMLVIDIEVSDSDGFPEPEYATSPVTAITAYDSYADDYTVWVLESEHWSGDPECDHDHPHIYDDEAEMLSDFHQHVETWQPDLLSGWNSDGFDLPYLINRSKNLYEWGHTDWSPIGETFTTRRGSAIIKGVTPFDVLSAYKKTQIHNLKSYTLDYVAERELGKGKVGLGTDSYDEVWNKHPAKFIEYNIRDVESVVEIERAQDIIPMFENMRSVTGAQTSDMIGANINMVDMLFLRRAYEQGIALPTSESPDEDWYHGAVVFEPIAGLHTNVVYPDLASLYPNMMVQCNMSPDTLIGDENDLVFSQYSEGDCVWSYVDPRPVKRVEHDVEYTQYKNPDKYKAVLRKDKNGNYDKVWAAEPEYEKLYYIDPDKKEGFVSGGVKQLIDMKYEYKGTDKYDAVKRVVNSCYGVFGDSSSFGTGFRLFDHRLAESITLGGRKVITYSSKTFTDRVNDVRDEWALAGEKAYRVGGDTDSSMNAIPFEAPNEQILQIAHDTAEYVNDSYDQFCIDEFGVEDHYMDIEVESFSSRCFIPRDKSGKDPAVGAKKRYVTHIIWDDDDEWDADNINIKGFEAVRSDVADISVETQKAAFNILMYADEDEMREQMYELIQNTVEDVESGAVALEVVGIPSSIGQELSEYGSENRRPQPQYRGAKYANDNIYGSNVLSEGSKPLQYLIKATGANYPTTYIAETAEDGDRVDCVSVVEASDIPNEFTVDIEAMIEKTLEKPLRSVCDTMGWSFSDARHGMLQTDIMRFM